MTITPRKTAAVATILLAGGAMLVASAALARGPGDSGMDFTAMDADGNGEITMVEFEAFKAAKISEIDADGDGFITADELQAMKKARNEERAAARFGKLTDRLDADGDGQISVDEFAAMGHGRGGDGDGFPRGLDTDGDGVVTEEEFADAKENRGKRRGGDHKRGDHGPKDGDAPEGGSD